jgi:hypothetical protein
MPTLTASGQRVRPSSGTTCSTVSTFVTPDLPAGTSSGYSHSARGSRSRTGPGGDGDPRGARRPPGSSCRQADRCGGLRHGRLGLAQPPQVAVQVGQRPATFALDRAQVAQPGVRTEGGASSPHLREDHVERRAEQPAGLVADAQPLRTALHTGCADRCWRAGPPAVHQCWLERRLAAPGRPRTPRRPRHRSRSRGSRAPRRRGSSTGTRPWSAGSGR